MSNTTNRTELQRAAALVRPALAAQPYIPALTHIRFDGTYATAFNDKAAIAVRCETGIERLVPGIMLVQALGSFGGAEVLLQTASDGNLVVSSGRSKVKLPTLGLDKFPFSWPEGGDGDPIELPIDAEVIRGIDRCLLSVGNDERHPAQMGITLDRDDKGRAVLFSTDNRTCSRFQTTSKVKLPGDAPVIMPRFFCEQVVALRKEFPEEDVLLVLYVDSMIAEFGDKARLFSRMLADANPMDFPAMFAKHVGDDDKPPMKPIPDSFDAALARAILVLQGEVSKTTKLECGSRSVRLRSESSAGECDDNCEGDMKGQYDEPVSVDPVYIARGAKATSLMMVTSRCTVFADEKAQFIHLVAHVE